MSAAETIDAPAPAKSGKRKLIVIALIALLVLGGGGAAAFFLLKKKAPADADGGAPAAAKHDEHKKPPVFLPLDPFIVNLADTETERFAQIGITLELDDPKVAEELKTYMPAIRNGVLLVLAHKTSRELMGRKGKEALAAEIMREAVRPLGIESDDKPQGDAADAKEDDGDDADKDADHPKAKADKKDEHNPVRHVHFSSFIIQ